MSEDNSDDSMSPTNITEEKTQQNTDIEKNEERENNNSKDDFEYLQHDRETFHEGPVHDDWENKKNEEIQQKEDDEKKKEEELQMRAQKMREEYLQSLKAKQEQKKMENKRIKAPAPSEAEDVFTGWEQVMKIVKPLKPNIDPKEMKTVKDLYLSLKK